MNKFITTLKNYDFYKKLELLPFIDIIILFGSRTRGGAKAQVDIDLAIVCPDASWNDWLLVLEIIDNADTLLKIDCIRFDSLHQSSPIRQKIETKGVIAYVKSISSK